MNPDRQTTIDHGKLFEPDELSAEQYYQTTKRSLHASPEHRLVAAVLEDAVATLTTDQRRCSRRQQRDFAEALDWLRTKNDPDRIFSFENVCDALAIDSDYLRQGLLRKIEQMRSGTINPLKGRGRYLSPRRKVVRMHAG